MNVNVQRAIQNMIFFLSALPFESVGQPRQAGQGPNQICRGVHFGRVDGGGTVERRVEATHQVPRQSLCIG